MRVRLNLATKPLQTHRRFLVGAAAVAAVGAILFLALGWHVYATQKARATTQARMEALRAEQQNLDSRRAKLDEFFKRPENAKLAERAAYLNSIIDESSFLWTQMFMDLERVKPGGIRLLSVAPKMVKGNMEVHLKVGAQSSEAKLKFLRALEESRTFERVMVLNDVLSTQPGSDPQVFELSMVYSRI